MGAQPQPPPLVSGMAPRTESSTILHTAPGWVGELVDAPGEEDPFNEQVEVERRLRNLLVAQPALAQLPILDLGDWRAGAGSERRDAFVAGLRLSFNITSCGITTFPVFFTSAVA